MSAASITIADIQDSISVSHRIAQLLDMHGYCIVEHAVSIDKIADLDHDLDGRFAATPCCDGGFYGRRTKRFGSLLRRSAHVAELVQHRAILSGCELVLGSWCDRIALNLTQAIEIHPGALAQLPHRDQDMWQGSKGEVEYLVNVMWPLSPFTPENGATVIWPGSHRDQSIDGTNADAVAVDLKPGSALLFLGSTLHGGGANTTTLPRRGVIISYCLGWLKPFENQWLVYPPEVARDFESSLAALVGYAQHRPNLGNYEGQCPSVLLGADPPPDILPAVDALRPDQAEQLEAYILRQSMERAERGP